MLHRDTTLFWNSGKSKWAIRALLALVLLALSLVSLFITFKGLNHASVMDQAQIARNLANGRGMVTQFIRPLDIAKVAKIDKNAAKKGKPVTDSDHFPSIHHAPLNIWAMAAALKMTGYHHFDAKRAELAQRDKLTNRIYPGDRVIAATSLVFFIIAAVLGYSLLLRLFDEWVAASVCVLMIFNSTVFEYALSGLPQPLMMCCLLAAAHFILSAVATGDDQAQIVRQRLYVAGALLFLTLMVLSGWSAMWCLIGFAVFCAMYFNQGILYAAAAALIIYLLEALVISPMVAPYGDGLRYYFLLVSNCLGGDVAEAALRSGVEAASAINNSSFIVRLLGYAFSFFGKSVSLMGGLFIPALFFLALLKIYKRSEVNGFKWAIFTMWIACAIGMSLTAGGGEISDAQLMILFLPIFAAYGMSLIFNFTVLLKLSDNLSVARGFVLTILLLICSGAHIGNLVRDIPLGFALRDAGQANFPPYYPPALYGKVSPALPGLVDLTNPQDVIVTDQPWAVAWYSNRKAVWLPESVYMFDEITKWVNSTGSQIQGILITPTSTTDVKRGMTDIMARNGEFAPLAMEASVLLIDPKHNTRITDLFMSKPSRASDAKPLGYLVSSRGEFAQPHFLLGAHYVLYTRPTNTLL